MTTHSMHLWWSMMHRKLRCSRSKS